MNPVLLALLATLGTWFLTALGAATVFFFKRVNEKGLNVTLGFSAGIMLAASYFSLLAPAIEAAGQMPWLTVGIGFLSGGLALAAADMFFSRRISSVSGTKKRTVMLITSITLHNIPEGLAVGIAFGALNEITPAAVLPAAFVAIGIGLQNFPEGLAVSLPMHRDGCSVKKSFFLGQLSGIVEPVSGVLGALMVGFFTSILSFALSFAAGAMVFVAYKELIPEAQKENKLMPALGFMAGFTLMMTLDMAFS